MQKSLERGRKRGVAAAKAATIAAAREEIAEDETRAAAVAG
jgi:hypothetical protein